MANIIEVELNGLTFEIPVSGAHDWSSFSDWVLEVNETLQTTSTANLIPAGSANLVNATPVSLYTINSPQTNAHIIFEYGINRVTDSVNVSETGTMTLAYSTDGNWRISTNAIGDASVALSVSSGNVIQATATALAGTPSSSVISYSGRIITI